jgi:hypothetical protein
MTRVGKAQRAAAIGLHGIAKPYFEYPTLTRSAWYLPRIDVWEPWYGEPTNRYERFLWGKLIVPSVVTYFVIPDKSVDVRKFKRALEKGTGATWYADDRDLALNVVVTIRLSTRVWKFDAEKQTGVSAIIPFDEPIPEGWNHDRPP